MPFGVFLFLNRFFGLFSEASRIPLSMFHRIKLSRFFEFEPFFLLPSSFDRPGRSLDLSWGSLGAP